MVEKRGAFQKALYVIGKLIPGTNLKTWVYLNLIYAPRRFLRQTSLGFYRIDHIYEVLREFRDTYEGDFSVLEFGVADGYSFTKKLHAAKYLKMDDRVIIHGFDSFEGLPQTDSEGDAALIEGGGWEAGFYRGSYDTLEKYCKEKYSNFMLHRGVFEDTLTDTFLQTLLERKPALIWIDCDLYSSTVSIFKRLIPYLPTGTVVYFDDIYFNFSSRFTGEMRAVYEINKGDFGEGIELVLDRQLSWESNRVYRFINLNARSQHQLKNRQQNELRLHGDDSPFP
jgi:Macrocin-O-methyltransferase (TylF)